MYSMFWIELSVDVHRKLPCFDKVLTCDNPMGPPYIQHLGHDQYVMQGVSSEWHETFHFKI